MEKMEKNPTEKMKKKRLRNEKMFRKMDRNMRNDQEKKKNEKPQALFHYETDMLSIILGISEFICRSKLNAKIV